MLETVLYIISLHKYIRLYVWCAHLSSGKSILWIRFSVKIYGLNDTFYTPTKKDLDATHFFPSFVKCANGFQETIFSFCSLISVWNANLTSKRHHLCAVMWFQMRSPYEYFQPQLQRRTHSHIWPYSIHLGNDDDPF